MIAVVLSYEAFDEAGRRTRGDDPRRTPEELANYLVASGYKHAFIRSEGRLVAGIDPAGAWANPYIQSRGGDGAVSQRVDDGGQHRTGRISPEVRADIERVRSTRGSGAGAREAAARQEAQQREARRQQVRDRQRRDRGRER